MNADFINELLEQKQYSKIRAVFDESKVQDIAEFLNEKEASEALLLFRLLPKEIAADVFSYLSVEQQTGISALVNEKELINILNDLWFDDKIDFLEEMPANVVKKILLNASETERSLINQFLNYPEASAGSLMTIEFIDLKKEMRVGDALSRIREIGLDKETIYTCYVMDAHRRLEGTISLKDLVLSDGNKLIEDIMRKDPISVNTHEHQELVADVFKKYDLLSVPVVDNENRLVGIITIDDIVDVIEEENTEDFHKMAALQPTTESYLSSSVLNLAKKRIFWLLFLMVSATFSGYIIDSYNKVLQVHIGLAAFIPMLMDTAGNAGSQVSTLVIRGIALGELSIKNLFKIVFKELRVGILIGFILSILNILRVYFLLNESFAMSITIGLTLFIVVVCAKVIGCILPILAKQVNIDPAIMAGPMITTIVDLISLSFYFAFAAWILGIS